MRISLVDDHPLIREAVRAALTSGVPGIELRSYSSLELCISELREVFPAELLLLDLGLPGFTGIGALEEVRLACPLVPVVVLSAQEDRVTVLDCLDAGAMGYVPKSVEQNVFVAALRLVASGGVYIPPLVLRQAERNLPPATPAAARTGADAPVTDVAAQSEHRLGDDGSGGPLLTERQASVLRLIVKGLPNKLIARELNLSENTVKTHVSAVLSAIGVSSRTQAVLAASRLGMRI